MKTLRLTLLLVFFPFVFFAQSQPLTGLWMGAMKNDSTTVRKDDAYEIVLTEYRGKVYGYTRNTFFVDENLFYIVKRVEGVITGNICEVKDKEVITHNFPRAPERKVRVTFIFRRNATDSTWSLDGDWKTNTTKKYYTISGKSELKTEKDLSKSKLFPHLEELKKTDDVAVYQEWKKTTETSVADNSPEMKEKLLRSSVKNEKLNSNNTAPVKTANQPVIINTESKSNTEAIAIKPAPKKTDIAIEKQTDSPGSAGIKKETASVPVKSSSVSSVTPPPQVNQKAEKTTKPVAQPVTSPPAVQTKTAERNITPEKKPELPPNDPPVIVKTNVPVQNTDAAKSIAERDFDKPQVVNFTSDSLVLALYDNGEVDGDTVSVLLNGEVIIPKQCLKTVAFKKTIYYTPGQGDMNLVLYAENLGSYPPNTGLLVIIDGEERYNVRFSADLKKNAAIILKRKE
jgi:hypothetical protein